MADVHLLGTGAAVTDPHRTTTMLGFDDPDSAFLVDCGGDAFQRALQSGMDPDRIQGIFLTHEHPDHVAGFPLLLLKMWLTGRKSPLHLWGLEGALDTARRAFEIFDTSRWELPDLHWTPVELREGAPVFENRTWSVTAAPGIHSVPVLGLRVEHRSGFTTAYSCDTERSAAITRLAQGADLLLHEANGARPGHSSVEDAVEVARAAGVDRLVLVHLPPGMQDQSLASFTGDLTELRFAVELERIRLDRVQ